MDNRSWKWMGKGGGGWRGVVLEEVEEFGREDLEHVGQYGFTNITRWYIFERW